MTDFDPTHKFFVGQWVVCVDAQFAPAQRTTIACELTKGAVYNVRWLGVFTHYLDGEYLGIKVEGVERGEDQEFGYHDMPFYARRFRPVVHDPLASLKQIAADPEGYRPVTEEGPRRGKKLPVRVPVKVEVE